MSRTGATLLFSALAIAALASCKGSKPAGFCHKAHMPSQSFELCTRSPTDCDESRELWESKGAPTTTCEVKHTLHCFDLSPEGARSEKQRISQKGSTYVPGLRCQTTLDACRQSQHAAEAMYKSTKLDGETIESYNKPCVTLSSGAH